MNNSQTSYVYQTRDWGTLLETSRIFIKKTNKIKLISKERENKEIKKINLLISTMIFDWWVHS